MKPPGLTRRLFWPTLAGLLLAAGGLIYHYGLIDKIKGGWFGPEPPRLAAATFPLTDLGGRPQGLAQWQGKVLVVNYWATWCAPCREEMPGFSRLHDKYQAKGVQFVGISIDTVPKIIQFQKDTPVSYPLLVGGMEAMAKSAEFGNSRQALPFTAVFDRDGRLAMTRLGRWKEEELEARLKDLL